MSEAFPEPRQKGVIELLCDEIGFRFDSRLERADVLVSFVRVLVNEVADQRLWQAALAHMTGRHPSQASGDVLALTRKMLAFHPSEVDELKVAATRVHDLVHKLNSDKWVKCDHICDMLSSCASAIRFGLEKPCHSRHAAEAANHIWRQLYGVSRLDRISPAWGKDWARVMLQNAIIELLPPPHHEAKEPTK